MKHWAHNGLKALTSACVLSLLATVAWSQSLTWLGTLGGDYSGAYGVSDNGVVVGWSYNAAGLERAFRWENGVMQDLGTLGGGRSWALGVSANGAVVVGWATNAARQFRAFRWQNGVMQDLGTLGGNESSALGVSANGAVVVGWAYNAAGQERAFRWQNGVMQDLGTLGGGRSSALGVSANGAVVVGWAYNAPGQVRAFRWTVGGGMEDLNTTYASLLTNGSWLALAFAISPDGRYIVGWGYNAATRRYEAFLLDTGPRCTAHNGDVDANGCVDDADLLAVLFAFGNSGSNLGRVDVNCDGVVDDADLLIVLFNFGNGC
jgi:probable HAF family extracellular repeat protein